MEYSNLTEILKQSGDKDIVLLLGAGISVTAGIPTSTGIINDLQNSPQFPTVTHDDPITYYSLMNKLSSVERRNIFSRYTDKANVNVSNLIAARLLHKEKISHILTTNFDNLLTRAASLNINSLPVYDATFTTLQEGFKLVNNSIIYLHGQVHGFWQLNTLNEHNKYTRTINFFLGNTVSNKTVVIIGYSGLDPLFPLLSQQLLSAKKVVWVPFENEPPVRSVDKVLRKMHNTYLIKDKLNADQTLFKLGSYFNVLTDYNKKFFIDVLERLSSVKSVVNTKTRDKDILSISKNKISLAKDLYEDNAVQVARVEINKKHGDKYSNLIHLINNLDSSMRSIFDTMSNFPTDVVENFYELLHKSGRSVSSPSLIKKSIWWAEQLLNNSQESNAHVNSRIGIMYSELGRLKKEVNFLREAQKYFKEAVNNAFNEKQRIEYTNSWALSRYDIAMEIVNTDLKKAKEEFLESKRLYEKIINSDKVTGKVLGNYSGILLDMYYHYKEEIYLIEGKNIAYKAQDKSHGAGAFNIACYYSLVDDYDNAFKWLEVALKSRNHSREQFEQDICLEKIRKRDKFHELLNRYRK